MPKTFLLFLSVISILPFSTFANSKSKCEREVAAKVLMLKEVDRGLESIEAELEHKNNNHERVAGKIESKNSIYFYTYQLAEQICKNVELENNEIASN